jgi:hypothetical protein
MQSTNCWLPMKFSQEVRTKAGEPVTPEQPRMRSYCLIKLFNLIRLVPAKENVYEYSYGTGDRIQTVPQT